MRLRAKLFRSRPFVFGAAILIIAIIATIGAINLFRRPELEPSGQAQKSSSASSGDRADAHGSPAAIPASNAGSKKTAKSNLPYYVNNDYGFSYSYPSKWTTSDDIKLDPAQSDNKQEFSTGLKLKTDEKYNDTLQFGVVITSLAGTEAWYDNYYAQSESNQVKKTKNDFKGKQSIQYDIVNSGQRSKLYLFAVGSKTYTTSSINEDLNLKRDPSYWLSFDEVVNSLVVK